MIYSGDQLTLIKILQCKYLLAGSTSGSRAAQLSSLEPSHAQDLECPSLKCTKLTATDEERPKRLTLEVSP